MWKKSIGLLTSIENKRYYIGELSGIIQKEPGSGLEIAYCAAKRKMPVLVGSPLQNEVGYLAGYEWCEDLCRLCASCGTDQVTTQTAMCIQHGYYYAMKEKDVLGFYQSLSEKYHENTGYRQKFDLYKSFAEKYDTIWGFEDVNVMFRKWRSLYDTASATDKKKLLRIILGVYLVLEYTGGYWPKCVVDNGKNARELYSMIMSLAPK